MMKFMDAGVPMSFFFLFFLPWENISPFKSNASKLPKARRSGDVVPISKFGEERFPSLYFGMSCHVNKKNKEAYKLVK